MCGDKATLAVTEIPTQELVLVVVVEAQAGLAEMAHKALATIKPVAQAEMDEFV
jgi:hypothetical protein